MSWTRRLYPVLFALFPPLGVLASRPTYIDTADVAVVCLVCAAVVALVIAAAYAVLRPRVSHEAAFSAAASAAFAIVGLIYGYAPLRTVTGAAVAHPLLAVALAGVTFGAVLWAYWSGVMRRLSRAGVERYLTLVGTVLVVWSLADIAINAVVGARALRRSELIAGLAGPVRSRHPALPGRAAGDGTSARQRDVYVIVLDEYPSSAVLRARFRFENSAFEDSLRSLGFRIPASVRSNYYTTLLSVASLLNFSHLTALQDVMDPASRVGSPAWYLIEHSRAASFLKARGYQFVLFPSAWFAPTRTSEVADTRFEPYTHFDLARAIYRSNFRTKLVSTTLVRFAAPYFRSPADVYADHAARTFAGLAAMRPGSRPTFAFAHVLMPHPPWVVDGACRTLRPAGMPSTGWDGSPASRTMFAAQVECVNSQTLRMVRSLLASSTPKPIIILQGDHGTESTVVSHDSSPFPTREQAQERLQAFGAYYLPDGGAAGMPDSTSVVNVLRYVFSFYFDADLPPLPNVMYYSYEHPYDLVPVSDDFTVGQPAGGAPLTRSTWALQQPRHMHSPT